MQKEKRNSEIDTGCGTCLRGTKDIEIMLSITDDEISRKFCSRCARVIHFGENLQHRNRLSVKASYEMAIGYSTSTNVAWI